MTSKEKSKKLRSIKGKLKTLHSKILDLAICETDSAGVCIEKCLKVVNLAIKMRLLFAEAKILLSIPAAPQFQSGGMKTIGDSGEEFIINGDGKLAKV